LPLWEAWLRRVEVDGSGKVEGKVIVERKSEGGS
jgi:hypothetical protein